MEKILANRSIKSLKFSTNFIWTFTGNTIYAASQWAILTILAKCGNPNMVGLFSLGVAIVSPVYMFSNLQLRTIQATDSKNSFKFGEYFALRLISTFLSIIVLGLYSLFFRAYDFNALIVIFIISLTKAVESFSDIFYGLFQKKENMQIISISMILKGIFTVITIFLAIKFTSNLNIALLCMLTMWFLLFVNYDMRNGRNILAIKPIFNNKIKLLVMQSIPMGFVMMLISFNANIPKYFIEGDFGKWNLGIFSAVSYIMVVGNIVVSALGQVATPRLAKLYANKQSEEFIKLETKLCLIGALLGLSMVIISVMGGRFLLRLLYSPDYVNYNNIFVLTMISAGIGYISAFLGQAITSARYFRIQVPLTAMITVLTYLFSFLLIPKYGLIGAAWVLILTSLVQLIGSIVIIIVIVRKIQKNFTD